MVKSEADSVFEKNFTDELKVNEDCFKVYTEKNNVINNFVTAGKILYLLR